MIKRWVVLGCGLVGLSLAACSSDSSNSTGAGGSTTSATTGSGGAGGASTTTTGAGGDSTTTTTTTGAGGGGGAAAAACHDACTNGTDPDPGCLSCFQEKKAQGGPCYDQDQACLNDDGGGMMNCSTCAQLLSGGQDPPCTGSVDLANAELDCICTPEACGP